ncbi:flagellar protein FlaG [Pseudomonas sp. NPDC089395]|uniref:flagellar protein FlaG n=1 Tax=Pseudomonas sp. NPDC089395 TaxID=3364460 RepID=UPI0038185FC3
MDMSVKLNLSYPAPRVTEHSVEKSDAEKLLVHSVEANPVSGPRTESAAEDADKVKDAVSEIEKFLNSTKRNLQFSTDEQSGRIVVKVIVSETGELIRQLPSEEALRIANSLSDVNSLLFDAKV